MPAAAPEIDGSTPSTEKFRAGPQIGDHWHITYGIYICDHYLAPFLDDKESDPAYQAVQVHSHGDGIIHWHVGTEGTQSTGTNARLKVFLKLYGVTLTDDELALTGSELNPPGSDVTYREGQDRCPGQSDTGTASLRVVTWDAWYRPEERTVDVTSLGEERVIFDQQSFAVVFAADSVADAAIPLPPSASDLATVNEHPDAGGTATTGR